MPKKSIETASSVWRHLRVKTQADALSVLTAKVTKSEETDDPIELHDVDEEYIAYVDWGRWIILCDCGAGVAVHPEWSHQYCFGCGAVFSNVTFPEDRIDVEATLVLRPKNNQFFFPQRGETLETLEAENRAHGLSDVVKGDTGSSGSSEDA